MQYSKCSERLPMEEIDYCIPFRWLVGMDLDQPVWNATTITENGERLPEADVARTFPLRWWSRPGSAAGFWVSAFNELARDGHATRGHCGRVSGQSGRAIGGLCALSGRHTAESLVGYSSGSASGAAWNAPSQNSKNFRTNASRPTRSR
jgi:hypothetical protein